MAILLELVRVNANSAGNGHDTAVLAPSALKIDNQNVVAPVQLCSKFLRRDPCKSERAVEALPSRESPARLKTNTAATIAVVANPIRVMMDRDTIELAAKDVTQGGVGARSRVSPQLRRTPGIALAPSELRP